jgi:transposase
MTRLYSDDLRARVAAAVLGGQTCRAAAALFDVSMSAAASWSARLRAEGGADAKPMSGARRAMLAGERDWLLERITSARSAATSAAISRRSASGVRRQTHSGRTSSA